MGRFKKGLVEACYSFSCHAIECVVHGCDVLNKRGFARPYMQSEHTLVLGCWRETVMLAMSIQYRELQVELG